MVRVVQRAYQVWLEREECKVQVEALDQQEMVAVRALPVNLASLGLSVSDLAFVLLGCRLRNSGTGMRGINLLMVQCDI